MAGCVGLLHTALVPPVLQPGSGTGLEILAAEETELAASGEGLDPTRRPLEEECRYARFIATRWPFTRGYDAPRASVAGMLSEAGVLVAATGFLYLLFGFGSRRGGRPDA